MREICKAQVVSQAAPDKVYVVLPSGQIPGYPVRVLTQGPADAMRVDKKALPTPGTWGIVMFPAGDVRNGVWLGAYYAQFVTAHDDTEDPHQEYMSHYSGYYKSLDQKGNENIVFPDGTSIIISTTGELAETFRQTVSPGQNQEAVPFTAEQRVPDPPSPFYLSVKHASGTTIVIDPNGTIVITGVDDINVNAAGIVNINAATAIIAATSITLDGNTEVEANLVVTGDFTLG